MKTKKSPLVLTFVSIATIIFAFILVFLGYVSYVYLSFYRIDDNQTLEVFRPENNNTVSLGKNYNIITFNIGFGAYDDQFDFFMDDGYLDSEGLIKIHGKHARAVSKNHVLNNTDGIINIVKSLNPDFALFQEVDTDSTRSYHINQEKMITQKLNDYSYTKAINYHSKYLCYPFYEPIGKSNSEILTLSKSKAVESIRRSLPLSPSRWDNLVDLDRCIMINRYPIENSSKQLVVINVHLSAYDEGGKVRRMQSELLGKILNTEKQQHNYVIVGGDFNQILIPEGPDYYILPNGEITPDWVANWENSYDGYIIVDSKEGDDGAFMGTARNNTKAFDPNWTYTCSIDGFIISDNIKLESINTITSHAFKYSDHNPVKLTFSLK